MLFRLENGITGAGAMVFNKLSQTAYDHDRDNCIKPEDIHPDETYMMHLRLREVMRFRGMGIYATSSVVKVVRIDEEVDAIKWDLKLQHVGFKEEVFMPIYNSFITAHGIIGGEPAPMPIREGYFSMQCDGLDSPGLEAEDRKDVPVYGQHVPADFVTV